MLPKSLFLFCLLFLVKSSLQISSRRYNFVINNVTCVKFTDTLKLFECQVKKLATNEYGFSGKFIFTKTMHKNFFTRFFVDTTTFSKNNLVRFIDIKMNGCDAIRTRFDIPLVQQVMLEVRRASNLPFQCPFEANFPYSFENVTISDKFLNQFLPYLHFVHEIVFYEKEKVIGSIKTSGSILAKSEPKKM